MILERISLSAVFNALAVLDSGHCQRYVHICRVMEGEEECRVH